MWRWLREKWKTLRGHAPNPITDAQDTLDVAEQQLKEVQIIASEMVQTDTDIAIRVEQNHFGESVRESMLSDVRIAH